MLGLVAWVVLLGATSAEAQVPATSPPPPPGTVPTYWVMMVTGERDGAPWMKTTTPETLGGSVKGTGPWSCTYPATARGADADFGFEQMEIACGVGEAEEPDRALIVVVAGRDAMVTVVESGIRVEAPVVRAIDRVIARRAAGRGRKG